MSGYALVGVLLSVVFPGLGQGLAGRRKRMVAWALGLLVAMVAILVTVWFVPVMLLVRIASAIDAYRCLKRTEAPANYIDASAALFLNALLLFGARSAVEGFKIPSSSMYPTLIIGDHVFVDKLSPLWHPPERGEVIVFTQPCSKTTFIKRVIARGGDTVEVRCSRIYVNGAAVPSTLVETLESYRDRDASSGRTFSVETSRYRETLGGRSYDTFHDRERPTREDAGTRGDFPSRDRMFPPACTQGDYFERDPHAPSQPMGRLVQTKPESTASACEPLVHFVVPAGTLFMMGDNRNNANDSRYWGVVRENAVIGRVIGIWSSDGPEGSWSRFGAID
jgi:signal peptidase I